MFNDFLEFIGEKRDINSKEEFLKEMGGKSFLNGMYRVFDSSVVSKWNSITEQTFPLYKNKIEVFGYDWLGRIFAVDKLRNIVLLFEPGTGEVLNIPVSIEEFHDSEIVEYHEDSLASNFFEEWFSNNDKYCLKTNECAGYIVPLFLNGDDVISNLEVSDMEAYWEIMMPLINL